MAILVIFFVLFVVVAVFAATFSSRSSDVSEWVADTVEAVRSNDLSVSDFNVEVRETPVEDVFAKFPAAAEDYVTSEDVEENWNRWVSIEREAAEYVKAASAPVVGKVAEVASRMRRSASAATASRPESAPRTESTPTADNAPIADSVPREETPADALAALDPVGISQISSPKIPSFSPIFPTLAEYAATDGRMDSAFDAHSTDGSHRASDVRTSETRASDVRTSEEPATAHNLTSDSSALQTEAPPIVPVKADAKDFFAEMEPAVPLTSIVNWPTLSVHSHGERAA